ncbi:MAG: hypothetical protein WA667_16010 [Candidatus Nitrosopolaris sp.]
MIKLRDKTTIWRTHYIRIGKNTEKDSWMLISVGTMFVKYQLAGSKASPIDKIDIILTNNCILYF